MVLLFLFPVQRCDNSGIMQYIEPVKVIIFSMKGNWGAIKSLLCTTNGACPGKHLRGYATQDSENDKQVTDGLQYF